MRCFDPAPKTNRRWGVLFDLDNTLVLTDAIEALRRKPWSRCYAAFGLTKLPPGTVEFIERLRPLATLGVVTMAPRPYAEKLLAHHNLPIPVLVGYHDVVRRKPHPDPIAKATAMLQIPANECVYIGDDPDDIVAAASAGAVPIGLSWDGSLFTKKEAEIAAGVCEDWKDVMEVLRKFIG
jgi:HAD superfamily hydrolase (TIGR01549 family)